MKKLIILLAIVLMSFVTLAQERTVNSSKTTFKPDVTYIEYLGVAADSLKETSQDTIDFWFTNQNHKAVEKLVFTLQLDTLAGNDSIYYSLFGYNDTGTTGTSITTGGLLVNASNDLFDIVKWYWTNATTYVDLSYRFYRLRFIQASNNSYDGGAKFDFIKAKLFLK